MKLLFGVMLFLFTTALGSASPQPLSLEQALQRIGYHPYLTEWAEELQNLKSEQNQLLNKQLWHVTFGGSGGGLLQYNLGLDQQSDNTLVVRPTLTAAKSLFSGVSLRANVSAQQQVLVDSPSRVTWSLEVTQAVRPSPRFSSENAQARQLQSSIEATSAQESLRWNTVILHVEELYRNAQFSLRQYELATQGLMQAREQYEIVKARAHMGEANELALLNGRLAVSRAEREEELARQVLNNEWNRLRDAIDLDGEFTLDPLATTQVGLPTPPKPRESLVDIARAHSVQLEQHRVRVEQAQWELASAIAQTKPSIHLGATLARRERELSSLGHQADTDVTLGVSVSVPLADGYQRQQAVAEREQDVVRATEAWQTSWEQVERAVDHALDQLWLVGKELEISELQLDKARVELAIATKQYAQGLIDKMSLAGASLSFELAQLSYWERLFQYSLAVRRLDQGILVELGTVGGQAR